jgi:hypothetical protein
MGVLIERADVGFWGRSGNRVLDQSSTGFDPEPTLNGFDHPMAVAECLAYPLIDTHQFDILPLAPGERP